MKRWFALAAFAIACHAVPTVHAADGARGQVVYDGVCRVCHGSGIAGSPKMGDRAAWSVRLQRGLPTLYATAMKGKGAMPPKGGRLDLPDADIQAAVDFMLRASVGEVPGVAGNAAAPRPATQAASAPTPTAAPAGARRTAAAASPVPAAAPAPAPARAGGTDRARTVGAQVFQANCAVCHASGLAGAPRLGDAAAWRPRAQAGTEVLYHSALSGKRAMPARGGNAQLSDADVRAAVDFILLRAGLGGARGDAPAPRVAATATQSPAVVPASAPPAEPAPAPAPAAAPTAAAAAALPPPPAPPVVLAAGNPNAFNRLLRSSGPRHQPPASDGIHDPENDGTLLLQTPEQALAQLPKRNSVGDVDWVKALATAGIAPRSDLQDPAAQMMVLDLNIVREVKGSMPNVVYPHEAHTRWLDCSNCHPAIFTPQKGANQISMAAIMLGQKCGVCHGTVAFPVNECRRCHSQAKTPAAEAKP